MFDPKRIGIGTANFQTEYNGVKVPPEEQQLIWQFCKTVGIDTVDTAFAYGESRPNDFKVITKLSPTDKISDYYYAALVHHFEDFGELWPILQIYKKRGFVQKIGVSLYRPTELFSVQDMVDMVQVPYNLKEKSFGPHFGPLKIRGVEVHVRSIFGGGKLLKNKTPKECLDFVLANKHIDKAIIGIETAKQLRENLDL